MTLRTAAPEREEAGHTMVYSTAARVAAPLREEAAVRSQRALLVLDGRRLVVWMDEFSKLLSDPSFESFAKDGLKTWRKLEGVAAFATWYLFGGIH